MPDPRVDKFADLLVVYSARVKPGEIISVFGSEAAKPLIVALYRRILVAGAHPRVHMSPDGLEKVFYDLAGEQQLAWLDPVLMHEYDKCDHLIRILAETNTRALSSVDPARQRTVGKARAPLRNLMVKKDRWSLTLFPTEAYAQDAEMSLGEFEDFVFAANFLDRPDPVAAWTALADAQQRLADRLNRAREIRIVCGDDTDLTLGVAGRTWINSSATHNVPSGEVFTGPVEDAVRGKIRYSFPIAAFGKEIADVRLEFRDGRAVAAAAGKNEDFLIKMLDSDPGARVLGELGVGTNYGIRRHIKNILFDEKIGGSIHTALGNSYPQTGGRNVSSLHWDLIKDLRAGGEMYVDGRLFQKDGKFLEFEF
jgi:aminopeptidase